MFRLSGLSFELGAGLSPVGFALWFSLAAGVYVFGGCWGVLGVPVVGVGWGS